MNGLPNVSKLNLDLNNLPCFIIIDDQMTTLLDSPEILDIVSVKCHHFNLTICIVLHNFLDRQSMEKLSLEI